MPHACHLLLELSRGIVDRARLFRRLLPDLGMLMSPHWQESAQLELDVSDIQQFVPKVRACSSHVWL